MTVSAEHVQTYLSKWQPRLRLQDWDIRLHLVETPWRKTGDIKIDLEGYLELGGDDTRLSFGRIGAQVEAELAPPAPDPVPAT